MKIKDIFEKPVDRKIEEVIKVTQDNEETVYDEIQEYVVTDKIKAYYRDILKSVIDAKSAPHEGIGIWVSGFFGSGKSSFAKILGYILEGRTVIGKDTRDLFNHQANDKFIADNLNYLKEAIPIKSIIFDISMDRGVRQKDDSITKIMYKVFLRELNYAEDFDIAKLEIDLEENGKLDKFIEKYEKEYDSKWSKGRKRASALNEASAVLHLMEPKTYNLPDSWVKTIKEGRADITPINFAKIVFELMERRRKGTTAVFIVDEIGQYVSRSVDKMLDLQAIVQALGVESKNRVKAKKAISPVWLVVTSQEKLNEIVSSLDDKRIELARLRDRFPNEVDIVPTDIAEVTGKRVLRKKANAISNLKSLFDANENRLNQCCKLEHTSRSYKITQDDFVNLYPYLPHFIELSIDIMSGIRLLPGAHRFSGGSNRTIIKQAQQMLINPKVNLADENIGTLVTLDKIFDLIESNLSSERQKDIADISKRFADKEWVLKVAKAICLLEFVRDLPRTAENIAAVLFPNINSDSVLQDVKLSIEILETGKFIKLTEDGYKLLTVQEKNWDIKRNDLSPKPLERNKIKKDVISDILSDSKITIYKHNGRPFKISFRLDDQNISQEGDLRIDSYCIDEKNNKANSVNDNKILSREDRNKNKIIMVFSLNEDIHNLIDEVFKSDKMIENHKRLAAEGMLPADEHKCFNDEKIRKDKYSRRLRELIEQSIYAGVSLFRGVERDMVSLGINLIESVKNLIDIYFSDIFPKYELGAKSLNGKEAEQLLTANNLNGLPTVIYDSGNGIGLVKKEGGKYLIDTNIEIAQEIMNFVNQKHSFGDKLTGKILDEYFSGYGFGWQRDMLRLVLAGLFRAGKIEISYQGKRYRDYTEHLGREAITNNNAFKVAAFMPREQTLTLQQIKEACFNFEAITGEEIDADENTISKALKKLAENEKENLYSVKAIINANNLPCKDLIEDLLETFKQIPENSSDDCVKYLAEEGKELKQNLDKVKKITDILTSNIQSIKDSKVILINLGAFLTARCEKDNKILSTIQELKENLNSEDFFERIPKIKTDTELIEKKYTELYTEVHNKKNDKYKVLKERILGDIEWNNLPPDLQESFSGEIQANICEKIDLSLLGVCNNCGNNLSKIESDIDASVGIEQKIKSRIQEFIKINNEKVEIIRITDFIDKSVTDINEFKVQLNKLLNHIEELLKEGKRIILE